MASRSAAHLPPSRASDAWSQPVTLATTYAEGAVRDAREARDAYGSSYNLENALATSAFFQVQDCVPSDFQATVEEGSAGQRGAIGNIACKSLTPSRAAWERAEQIASGTVERQMTLPPRVAQAFADGADLNEAYAAAGLPPPNGSLPAVPPAPSAWNAGWKSSMPKGGSKVRLAVGAASGSSAAGARGMLTSAAFSGGRLAPSFDVSGSVSGPAKPYDPPRVDSGVASTPLGTSARGVYTQPQAADRLRTSYRN